MNANRSREPAGSLTPAPRKAPGKAAASAASVTSKTNPEAVLPSGAATDAAERGRMVAVAAYFRAERRGFVPSAELEDWLQAEAEVDAMLAKSTEDFDHAQTKP